MTMKLTHSQARKILRALRTGSAPSEFALDFFVGQASWFKVAWGNMLEVAQDEDFEVRFVKARYGGGKTLFLRCLATRAQRSNWVTAYILLEHKKVELDRFDTLVAEIAHNLELPDGGWGLRALLERALERIANLPQGFVSERVRQRAMHRILDICDTYGLDWKFSLALQLAMYGCLEDDRAVVAEVASWLGGEIDKLEIDPDALKFIGGRRTKATRQKLKKVGMGDAEQLIRLLALMTRLAGYGGLLLSLDEIELLTGLSRPRRNNCFQTLRALVDRKGRLGPPSTCLFLSATPEMFENPQMFPSYKALMDRISDVPMALAGTKKINFLAPVIDLDATELGRKELMMLSQKIASIYSQTGGELPTDLDRRLKQLVRTISEGSYVIARPRLTCRCVIDLLDGRLRKNLPQEVALRAKRIATEREIKIRGK